MPRWLSGRLIRNGPGLFEVGDTKYDHIFDGLALLHSFTINEGIEFCCPGKFYATIHISNLIILSGKVSYRSRFLRSDTYEKNMAANRIVVSEFGTVAHPDPCKTWFQRYICTHQDFINFRTFVKGGGGVQTRQLQGSKDYSSISSIRKE